MSGARRKPETRGGRQAGVLLRVDDLSVTHNGTPLVDGISFEVSEGETVGLVGESGSGKTVTAMAIMGLLGHPAVVRGAVDFEGTDLISLSPADLNRVRGEHVSMIFQEPMTCLNPAFTIGEQISEVVRRHRRCSRRQAYARAAEVLDQVGISSAARRLHAYPHEFSGGMRQRALIAMAISCEPSLLIADEPTTALDVTVQLQVLNLLRSLQQELGMAMLFITHDLSVIAEICDRVVIMYAGQAVETASVFDLFDRPAHPYTDALLGALLTRGSKGDALQTISGEPTRPGSWAVGCRFHQRCSHATAACASAPIDLRSVGDHRTSRCLIGDELAKRDLP